ncbi:MAG: DUF2811 domain-containing protein [Chloroflexi bacterium]|nr:DUF2811 domain-containing protein [Chloroflexota bacterium]
MVRATVERHRARVSVTVDPILLKAVDAFVQEHPGHDRSKVFDAALLLWYAQQQEKAIEAQHRAPQSEVEREEREAWHTIQVAAVERSSGQG